MTELNKNNNDDKKRQFKIKNNTNLTSLSDNNSSGFRSLNDSNGFNTGHDGYIHNFQDGFKSSSGFRSVMAPSPMIQDGYNQMSSFNMSLNPTMFQKNSTYSTSNTTPFSSSKNAPKILVNKKSLPKIETGSKTKIETWEGPLSQFTTFKSKHDAKRLQSEIVGVLGDMVKDKKVDYMSKDFEFYGRMYSRNDISEFQMQVYEYGEKNDKETKSIFEIRRTNGDSFVHEELFSQVTSKLKNFINKEGSNNNDLFNKFNGLPELTLDDLTFDDDDDEDINLNDDTNDDDVDMTDDQETDVEDSTEEWASDLLDVLKDRQSYRDTWRHSATQLCYLLEKENKLLEYVCKQKGVIDDILKPVTDQLYDCLIIKSVLQIIAILLKNNVQPTNKSKVERSIEGLERDWKQGPNRQLGPLKMSFTKSQQIVRECQECKTYLKN